MGSASPAQMRPPRCATSPARQTSDPDIGEFVVESPVGSRAAAGLAGFQPANRGKARRKDPGSKPGVWIFLDFFCCFGDFLQISRFFDEVFAGLARFLRLSSPHLGFFWCFWLVAPPHFPPQRDTRARVRAYAPTYAPTCVRTCACTCVPTCVRSSPSMSLDKFLRNRVASTTCACYTQVTY